MSDIECDLPGNSNFSIYDGIDISNLLFLYRFFIFFDIYYMLKLKKQDIYHFSVSLLYLQYQVLVYELQMSC